ncbi:MAG: glycosyl transferase family 1 [Boseongicola sp.]|nr:MAG: glycosyl transferase family 1 [Boseongicola sp.]
MPESGSRQFRPVTIVMAVFSPDHGHLEKQIASLAAQEHPISMAVAVIADKRSGPLVSLLFEKYRLPLDIVVPDSATASYKSFETGLERALSMSPADAVFALCDQDDVWHPDKISRSVKFLQETGASLVHSDARVVDCDGDLRRKSLHQLERRMVEPNLRELLLRNTVTGMTVLTTRKVVETSLPFPPQSALFFHHDLWLALVAQSLNGIVCITRQLVDYRQHGGNLVGAIEKDAARPKIATTAWYRHWAGTYAVAAYLAKSLYIRMGEVAALDSRLPDRAQLSSLEPYLTRRTIGGRFLMDAAAMVLKGRFDLAAQCVLFAGIQSGRLAWAVRSTLSDGLLSSLSTFDKLAFSMAPGAQPGSVQFEDFADADTWTPKRFVDKRKTASFRARFKEGTQQFVILVPTVNPAEVFAGVATAIDIGAGLAKRGHDVHFVATDMPIASRERSLKFVCQRQSGNQKRVGRRIRFSCGVTESAISFSRQDKFLATAWWTAHIAKDLLNDGGLSQAGFYYLIQDYEPGFYPWGTEYADARASYDLNFTPIFNSRTLADFFRTQRVCNVDHNPLIFHPSIDVSKYRRLKRIRNLKPRIAVYGRPKVPRNLFPLAIEGLEKFLLAEGIDRDDVELVSVGMVHPHVKLANGHTLRCLGKIPWDDYPGFLAGVDVGLSLMLSPHPSHPPIEMAAAGARVITNSFAGKDLSELTPSLVSVEPTPNSVAEALTKAWIAGPAEAEHRQFDLAALGLPLDKVVDELSSTLGTHQLHYAKAG